MTDRRGHTDSKHTNSCFSAFPFSLPLGPCVAQASIYHANDLISRSGHGDVKVRSRKTSFRGTVASNTGHTVGFNTNFLEQNLLTSSLQKGRPGLAGAVGRGKNSRHCQEPVNDIPSSAHLHPRISPTTISSPQAAACSPGNLTLDATLYHEQVLAGFWPRAATARFHGTTARPLD